MRAHHNANPFRNHDFGRQFGKVKISIEILVYFNKYLNQSRFDFN